MLPLQGLSDPIIPRPSNVFVDESLRVFPTQKAEGQMYRAPQPRVSEQSLYYVLNSWVYTAASKLAAAAAGAKLLVHRRGSRLDVLDNHPLAAMVGHLGQPNEYQDAYEFLELHFINLAISGNSYWYWYSEKGGAPEKVYQLDPRFISIVPGSSWTVDKYLYQDHGALVELDPVQITHFKRPNPFSRYFGLSPVTSLMMELATDRSQVRWNHDRFEDGVVFPSGILVVPPDTEKSEIKRIQEELIDQNAGGRRTHVLRAQAGGTVWHDAGMRAQDGDFTIARGLTRKSVYEAMDLPLGLMSESSTEAHAIVAKQQLADNIVNRHRRTAAKLSVEALTFWPRHRSYEVGFEDVARRHLDWRREIPKEAFLSKFRTPNEVREAFGEATVNVEGADRYAFEVQNEAMDQAGGGAGEGDKSTNPDDSDIGEGAE
jgi:HK97 family phage portal protein